MTDGEEEDLVAEFNKSLHIRKSENPRDFAERLEHIAESLAEFHGVHKTDAELIDQFFVQQRITRFWLTQQSALREKGKVEEQ